VRQVVSALPWAGAFNKKDGRWSAARLKLDIKVATGAQERQYPAPAGAIEAGHDIGDGVFCVSRPDAAEVADGREKRDDRPRLSGLLIHLAIIS
jgi:hypothetical protein